jgi:serine/threonine protein kinase
MNKKLLGNRYRFDEEIGRGGMGSVWKAYDTHLDQAVAIKIIPPELAKNRAIVEMLKREAKIALSLSHPNIVRLFNLEETNGEVFLVMEFVEGKDLSQVLLEKGKLSPEEAIEISKQVLDAIGYAHKKNVIHRDLKPANIIITRTNPPIPLEKGDGKGFEAKVLDFGIARVIKDTMTKLTGSGATSGTLLYMAPEQIRGTGLWKVTDIYAFGTVLYEMLSGHPPFHTGAIEYQIVNEPPQPIKGISEHLNNVVLKCLAKQPEARYQSAEDVKQAIEGRRAVTETTIERPNPKQAKEKPRPIKPILTEEQIKQIKAKRLKQIKIGLGALAIIAGLILGVDTYKYRFNLYSFLYSLSGHHISKEELQFLKTPPFHADVSGQSSGILTLNSEPSDAYVYISMNGKSYRLGKTPINKESLPLGTFTLIISKNGYATLKKDISIGNGILPLFVTLKKMTAYLNVSANVNGANVYIDEKYVGVTPLEHIETTYGRHTILVTMNNYQSVTQKIDITTDQFNATVNLPPASGYLTINANIEGAKIYIAPDIYIGTTPLTKYPINIGNYTILIKADGYVDAQSSVDIQSNQVAVVNADLKKKPGYLTVNTKPEGADVYLGNDSLGKTPLEKFPVAYGKYKLKIVLPNYKETDADIDVQIGKETTINENLEPLLGTIKVDSSPQGATVIIDNKAVGITPLEKKIIQGRKHISLALTGYNTVVRDLTVDYNKITSLNIPLTYIPGGLIVVLQDAWGRVLLDGQQAGFTGRPIENLRPGTHKIKVYNGDTPVYEGVIVITSNKITTLKLR